MKSQMLKVPNVVRWNALQVFAFSITFAGIGVIGWYDVLQTGLLSDAIGPVVFTVIPVIAIPLQYAAVYRQKFSAAIAITILGLGVAAFNAQIIFSRIHFLIDLIKYPVHQFENLLVIVYCGTSSSINLFWAVRLWQSSRLASVPQNSTGRSS